MKRIIEVICAGLMLVALLPALLFVAFLWLFVAPFALVYNIGMMGFDDGLSDWKFHFWWD